MLNTSSHYLGQLDWALNIFNIGVLSHGNGVIV